MIFINTYGCEPIAVIVKKCPFCGSNPMIKTTTRWPKDKRESVKGYTVVCVETECLIYDADNKYDKTPERAIKRWNKRAVPHD